MGNFMPRSHKKQQSSQPRRPQEEVPDLPLLIWGQQIAPFLSRNDCNNVMLCCKDICHAIKNHQPRTKVSWPTTQLVLKQVRWERCEMALSHDAQWLVVIPLPSSPQWRRIYVWNMNRGSLFPFSRLRLPCKTALPDSIVFSKDDKYLVIRWWSMGLNEFGVYDVDADTQSMSFGLSNYRDLRLDRFVSVRYHQITADSQHLIVRYRQAITRDDWNEFVAVCNLSSGMQSRKRMVNSGGAYFELCCTHEFILETPSFRIWYYGTSHITKYQHGSVSVDFPENDAFRVEHVSMCPTDSTLFAVLFISTNSVPRYERFIELFRLEKNGSNVSLTRTKFGVIVRDSPEPTPSCDMIRLNKEFQWSSDGKHIIMFNDVLWKMQKKFFAFPIDSSTASIKSHAGALVEKANKAMFRYLDQEDIDGFLLSSKGNVLVIRSRNPRFRRAKSQRPFIVSL